MAIKVNFANGTYTEDDFNNEFSSIVGSEEKVVLGNEDSLKVTQSSPLGLKVTVKSGKCFINGKFCVNDSNADVTIESNLSGASRKDIIVLDVANPQLPIFKAIKGNASAPTPTANQILLAEIEVKNNSLSIMDADIGNRRKRKDSISKIDKEDLQTHFDVKASETGYCKLPNGIIMQWGKASSINNVWKRINFPTPYEIGNFSVVVTEIISTGGATEHYVSPSSEMNKTYFELRCNSSTLRTFYWQSFGK